MICPKIKRIVVNGQTSQNEQQIVTGISDYIPQILKSQQTINISIIGNHIQIINQILWNEFFSKSLIKEIYYFLMRNYTTEGKQTMTMVFAKKDGKILKIDQVMDWKSNLRDIMLKEDKEVTNLEIQAFSNKGNIKKINIFVSKYPINIEKLNLILKTDSIQVAKISRNHFSNSLGSQQCRFLEETDRNNRTNNENIESLSTNKTKYSQISNISIKTKQSQISKQNCKQSSKASSIISASTKTDKKSNKNKSIEKTKDCPSKTCFQPKEVRESLTPQRKPINRQSVLAKILTSKEQQIILLKEQLQQKSYQYEMLLKQQDEAHKKQIENLTLSIKQVLQSYSASQKDAFNESLYLKERVKILQENIEKSNHTLEKYTQDMEIYVTHVRQLEDINKKLADTNKKLLEEQDRNRNMQINENNRMNNQLLSWKEKADDYKQKYQKIVDMMKNVINFT